ncbi:MAG: Asp-tRNA(Asn)/Glu-tRNA(Gln) amidotransferase subunit GatB [Oscillospiraceae bacterium]|jgi:aspartyl-tRNA(Asn)/glutamyl-tRNA(Gln) amidotransferase subunit B|nr:Asp-tRNA(Asn)/Glu-tRNA(Gln) amidotransferase subunit GatB [Oscillospiraceae bacterium]
MKLIPTIGLEIHAELMTASKVFCSCSAEFGGNPNTRCCPGCSAFPGTIPSLNKKAVELIIKAGAVLNCEISRLTAWDRKNYFYPDLPRAYQISQLFKPVCTNGFVALGEKRIRIKQIHLEEDAGKLIHDQSPKYSLADYNRAGMCLIEIVTEPDIHNAEEACMFVEKIRAMLQYADVCNGRMEQGALRCDVNISLAPEGAPLGVRAEIKNLNSIRSIARAIEYEIHRQTETIQKGSSLIQETRRFSDATGETFSMRTKENAHDYRYFPDPDIPPLVLKDSELEAIFASIPEMPEKRYARYTNEYGITANDAEILTGNKILSDFFEDALKEYNHPKAVCAFIVTELLRRVNLEEIKLEALPFSASDFGLLVKYGYTDKINRGDMKEVLREMINSSNSPESVCELGGYWIKEDLGLVESVIDEVIKNNPNPVAQYRNGEQKVFGFLMGQASKELKGKATPAIIKETLEKKLKG